MGNCVNVWVDMGKIDGHNVNGWIDDIGWMGIRVIEDE